MTNKDNNLIKDEVKDYYGKTLKQSEDLKTNACCTGDVYPQYVKDILSKIHDEVHLKYYGCGLTIPTALQGKKVLDLGSGAGRDCYIVSKLVGEEGEVIGVDMTDEQLEVANRHVDYHKDIFGYNKANVKFLRGEIEKLDMLGLPDNYFDVIISNCVINLSTDKEAVLKEVYRLLKPGGEMYFSDVYSDRRIPTHLIKDPVLYGECLSGALYTKDFTDLATSMGFTDPRKVDSDTITMKNNEIEELVGDINFHSITYRLFKIQGLENHQENYGLTAIYKGTLEECPKVFKFDDVYSFEKNKEINISGNTFKLLSESRFYDHFEFSGTMNHHKGSFQNCCVPKITTKKKESKCC